MAGGGGWPPAHTTSDVEKKNDNSRDMREEKKQFVLGNILGCDKMLICIGDGEHKAGDRINRTVAVT